MKRMKRKEADTKKLKRLVQSVILGIGCLLLSLALAYGVFWGMKQTLKVCTDSLVLVEAIVAVIAAVAVFRQLQAEAEAEEKQAKVDAAQFVFEFNQAFIQDEKMTNVEDYLASTFMGLPCSDFAFTAENRQDLVNYLVYLEGFSASVLQGVLELKDVDDLFAYRFFLAMNHPEVQALELFPCATYYRGCFKLYKKWLDYRGNSPKYKGKENQNWDIPLYESALCFWEHYPKYSESEIEVIDLASRMCRIKRNGQAEFVVSLGDEGRLVTHLSVEEKRTVLESLRSLFAGDKLRKRKNIRKLKLSKDIVDCLETEINGWIRKLCIGNGIFSVYKAGYRFFQLGSHSAQQLSANNLREIARLIYQTDAYIYPDMFGCESMAVSVIPKLLRSGKDAMFRLENLFVCEFRGEIVGIILWHKGPFEWKTDELCKLLVPLPPRFEDVKEQYVSGYAKVNEKDISILNLCISSEHREKHVASAMLRLFLVAHANDPVELCVLKENGHAIDLYKACDFVAVGKPEPAYPATKENHMRINMHRKK